MRPVRHVPGSFPAWTRPPARGLPCGLTRFPSWGQPSAPPHEQLSPLTEMCGQGKAPFHLEEVPRRLLLNCFFPEWLEYGFPFKCLPWGEPPPRISRPRHWRLTQSPGQSGVPVENPQSGRLTQQPPRTYAENEAGRLGRKPQRVVRKGRRVFLCQAPCDGHSYIISYT